MATFAAACEADRSATELVFTWNGEQVTVGVASECRTIGEEQIFEIELDDRVVMRVSGSTELITRDGERVTPPELRVGQSLMPLYTSKDAHGYPVYKDPGTTWKRAIAPADRTRLRKIGRMVAEWKEGPLVRGTYVEYIDGNRENYHPDNIRVVHKPSKARRTKSYDVVRAVQAGQDVIRQVEADLPKKKLPNNHTVIDVRPMELELVFELVVASTDVVAMCGVFLSTKL